MAFPVTVSRSYSPTVVPPSSIASVPSHGGKKPVWALVIIAVNCQSSRGREPRLDMPAVEDEALHGAIARQEAKGVHLHFVRGYN